MEPLTRATIGGSSEGTGFTEGILGESFGNAAWVFFTAGGEVSSRGADEHPYSAIVIERVICVTVVRNFLSLLIKLSVYLLTALIP